MELAVTVAELQKGLNSQPQQVSYAKVTGNKQDSET